MSKPTVIDILNNTGRLRFTGINEVAVAATENNWNPLAGGQVIDGVIYASAAGEVAYITGIDATNFAIGDSVTVVNVSVAATLVFFDGDPASLAANQIICPDRLPLLLKVGQSVTFIRRFAGGATIWRCKECTSTSLDPVSGMPPASLALAQLGYAPAALYRMNSDGGNAAGLYPIFDQIANLTLPAVNGAANFNYFIKGYQGVNIGANAFGFALADTFAPALASQAVVWEFSMPAHNAADIGIGGYDDIAGSCFLLAAVRTADDKVQVQISDQGGAHSATVVIDHVLTFGDRYCLVYHVNRTTDLLYTRLVNMTTRTAFEGIPLDISAYVTITGTVDPLFQVGFLVGRYNGTTITQMGLMILTAGIEGADVAANLTKRLTGV